MSANILADVRVLWPNLFVPKGIPGSPEAPAKFSCVVLFPTPEIVRPVLKELGRAMVEKHGEPAAKAALAAFTNGGRQPMKHWPIRRCDEIEDSALTEFDGWWARLSANTTYPPVVVDRRAQPVLDQTLIYSGCYCNVDFNAFGWSHPTGGKGVSLGLRAVQFVRPGDRIGGAGGHKFGALDDNDDAPPDNGSAFDDVMG